MQAVRINEKVDPDDTKSISAAKLVASEMVKYGYQPKSGLGPKSNGIVEPIQLKHQRGTNGLRYEATSGRVHHRSNKTIFVPEQALMPDQTKILHNWTISPSLFHSESCTHINKNPRSTVMTCKESTEQGVSDEQDHEEYDESMMHEYLPHEIEQVESQRKLIIDETDVVNLGDEEIVKEKQVIIHLEVERKQELIYFLK
ncbi:hypothetical protein R3W88_004169 [Solanum pinnatisectum]|uniref:G-patch domain-containing protein n=1 Tax=Solanum pinnatisectum TaxID=50273 RepID=A0AAV9K902_9SOLN|nr:hypothetical protein R3W88_004169 [Solanum pinnatisectum]